MTSPPEVTAANRITLTVSRRAYVSALAAMRIASASGAIGRRDEYRKAMAEFRAAFAVHLDAQADGMEIGASVRVKR